MPKMVSLHELEEKRGPGLLQEITIGKSYEQSKGRWRLSSLSASTILNSGRMASVKFLS